MTHPSIQGLNIERLFRRLSSRGYFEISPTQVVTGSTKRGDGWTETHYAPGVVVVWAPHGQGGPGGDDRFNPFAIRAFKARTLTEALSLAVEETRPPERSIDWRAGERERLRPCTCKHHGLYPRGDDGVDCPVHPHPKATKAAPDA